MPMVRKAPAVQVYAEDFLGGTTFMSNAEVGLYIRLLLQQVDKGALPDDPDHFAKAYGKECRKLWPVVRAKFIAGTEPGTIINERMAKAITDRDIFRERQREKGRLSAEARANGSQPRRNHGSTVVEPLGDGVIKNEGKERAQRPAMPATALEEFFAFYAAYPNKKAKGAAIKAWVKLKPDERALCKPAIEAQANAKHFHGKDGNAYVPHPATWLNERRWEDEVTGHVPALVNGKPAQLTKAEAIRAVEQIRVDRGMAPGAIVTPDMMPKEVREVIFKG